jgi:signal peptidase I
MKTKKNSENTLKDFWKKFWYLLWKDDSPKGWIFSIIFLFIFIKFIFFPVLSLVTGTALPLVIVESCSMYHQGNLFSNFDNWWENEEGKYSQFEITKEKFSKFIFKRGFNKGDILFIIGANPEKLKIGDVIIFEAEGYPHPIIHRIVQINERDGEKIFSTLGDNNPSQSSFEKEISEHRLVGKAVFKLAPYLGWTKLIFFEHKQPSNNKGFCNP